MINHQIALIQREIWEHRAIYIVPAIIATLLTLMTVTGQIQVTMHDKIVNLTIVFLSKWAKNLSVNALSLGVTALDQRSVSELGLRLM